MILIDIIDSDGNLVAMDMKFKLEEEDVAKAFVRDGFGAVIIVERETHYGKYWTAQIKRP